MAELTAKLKLLLDNRIKTPLSEAKKHLSKNIDEMKSKMNELKEAHIQSFQSLRNEIPMLDKGLKMLANPITLAVAGITAVGTAFYKSTTAALDLEKSMSEINATAKLSKEELEGLSDQLLDVGRRNVAPLEQVPEAFNRILSAGLSKDQALEALEPTIRAAKAGAIEIGVAATAGVNAMNASGENIDRVWDVLFATLDVGAAEMNDIAQYLPKIIPMGRQAGFALDETAGAFAFLTAQGQSAEASTTMLQNAFKSLTNVDTAKKFKDMGVKIYDAKGKMMPMTEIIESLSGKLDGLSDQKRASVLDSLGLDQRASSAFAIMTQDVDKFKDTLDATKNSQGQLNATYEATKTSLDDWKIAMNQIKYAIIKIGQLFLPTLAAIGKAVSSVINFIIEWKEVFIGIIAAFTAYLVVMNAVKIATMVWTAVQWLLNIALTANPIGIIIMAIGALIGAIVAVAKKTEGWNTLWNAVKVSLVNSFKEFVESWKFGVNYLWLTIQIFWNKIKSFGQWIAQFFKNIGEGIGKALKGDFSGAKEAFSRKITTEASEEVERLKAEREALTQSFKEGSLNRAKEIKDAWGNVSIRKKQDANESNVTTSNNGALTSNNDDTSNNNNTINSDGSATDKVTGAAKQIRNITVNIGALNSGGINTANTSLQNMSPEQIEEWFNQMLLRTIRNLELSY
jgi:TP901 family phage tail tape measure protein